MARMLVVDDADGVHEMLRTLLETMGIEGCFAAEGAEALEHYRRGDIDIVLSDIRMQPMDGLSLLKQLKKEDPQAVVILMTALDRKSDILQALKLGAFDFFVKPFMVNEFKDSIHRALRHREQLQAPRERAAAPPPQAPASAAIDADAAGLTPEDWGATEDFSGLEAPGEGSLKDEEAAAFLQEMQAEWAAQRQREEAQIEERNRVLDARAATLSEQEAALEARLESLVGAEAPPAPAAVPSDAEVSARLAELEEREALLNEREAFLEDSENALFDKGQQLQELKTELDHRQDQLDALASEAGLDEATAPVGTGAPDPAALAQLEAERAELQTQREALEQQRAALEERERALTERERQHHKTEALARARAKYLQDSESILFDRSEGVAERS